MTCIVADKFSGNLLTDFSSSVFFFFFLICWIKTASKRIISLRVLALMYCIYSICAIKGDISKMLTRKHHSQKQSLSVWPSISTTYNNHKTHREVYCSWWRGILTERHEKTKTEEKKNCNATLQYTWHLKQHLPAYTLFRSKEPQNKSNRKRKKTQKAILPFGENSHIIHVDMHRIMNTSRRVDHYNGFSNPSALAPSGRDNHHNPSSLDTV